MTYVSRWEVQPMTYIPVQVENWAVTYFSWWENWATTYIPVQVRNWAMIFFSRWQVEPWPTCLDGKLSLVLPVQLGSSAYDLHTSPGGKLSHDLHIRVKNWAVTYLSRWEIEPWPTCPGGKFSLWPTYFSKWEVEPWPTCSGEKLSHDLPL